MDPSRRGFLRGRLRGRTQPIRPPWSKSDAAFTAVCTRCDDCVKVCPSGIVRRGDAGFPEIDFGLGDKECTFCAQCMKVCSRGAFVGSKGMPAWHLRITISDSCLAKRGVICRGCADICESRAIQMTPLLDGATDPRVSEQLCSGCGACFSLCPVGALKISPVDHA